MNIFMDINKKRLWTDRTSNTMYRLRDRTWSHSLVSGDQLRGMGWRKHHVCMLTGGMRRTVARVITKAAMVYSVLLLTGG